MVCFYFLLIKYDCKMKIQYWLNEVFIIGYNYHIRNPFHPFIFHYE